MAVSIEKQKELTKRMSALGVSEEDLQETFVRGTGKGGQKVNKTSVSVVIRHRPSGLTVRCEESRSQALNRYMARRRLLDKLEAKILGAASAEQQRIAKLRRQKRKRSKRAKEKMLQEKKKRGETKTLRKKPSF